MRESLVIITCLKDQWNFEMLCISIKKYLFPCTIILIYNDKEETFESWKKFFEQRCSSYLSKHKVILKTQRDYWNLCDESHLHELQKEGWVDQQVLKLVASRDVKTPYYICLDSKNFFIRHAALKNITQIAPEPIKWTETVLENWVKFCCKTFSLKYPGKHFKLTQNTTPYIIDTKQAQSLYMHFGGIKKFYVWFTDNARHDDYNPSEFFLYEIWCKKQDARFPYKYAKQNCASMWGFQIEDMNWNEQDFINYIDEDINVHDVRIAGLHKTVKGLLTLEQIKSILSASNNVDLLPRYTSY